MRSALPLVAAIILSLVLGVGSAWLAVRSPQPIDAIELGAWRAWPNAGTAEADPYSRARLARTGEIPLGSGEGLMLLARTDDADHPLNGACDYLIDGQTPPARLWTVALETDDGALVKQRDGIAALASDTLLRDNDGSFRIALSAKPHTGNWMSTAGIERYRLVLRLYDTTARTGTQLTTLFMPKITEERC